MLGKSSRCGDQVMGWKNQVPGGARDFSVTQTPRQSLRPTQAAYNSTHTGDSFSADKTHWEWTRSLPHIPKVANSWSQNSTPTHAFTARTSTTLLYQAKIEPYRETFLFPKNFTIRIIYSPDYPYVEYLC